jgi:transcriptional regulator with XRE-family HTH domain
MNLELWKKIKKEKKLTLLDISKMSNIPKRTVDDIFAGVTKNPRTDTVEAIERALGLGKETPPLSAEEKELIELIKQMTDEETKELSNYIDYIVSKRK